MSVASGGSLSMLSRRFFVSFPNSDSIFIPLIHECVDLAHPGSYYQAHLRLTGRGDFGCILPTFPSYWLYSPSSYLDSRCSLFISIPSCLSIGSLPKLFHVQPVYYPTLWPALEYCTSTAEVLVPAKRLGLFLNCRNCRCDGKTEVFRLNISAELSSQFLDRSCSNTEPVISLHSKLGPSHMV